MRLVIKTTSDSGEASFLTLLIPLFGPKAGTNGIGHLTEGLALFLGATLLVDTDQPLIVTVPAVQGLVLRREALVTRACSRLFDHIQTSLLLFVELGRLGSKNLANLRHDLVEPKQIQQGLDGIWNLKKTQLPSEMYKDRSLSISGQTKPQKLPVRPNCHFLLTQKASIDHEDSNYVPKTKRKPVTAINNRRLLVGDL